MRVGIVWVSGERGRVGRNILNFGMSAPEWRRLRASMKKAKKGKLTSVKDVSL